MGVTYYCSYCNYETDHKAKHNRHMTTLKHQVSENGIVCCGLTYYEKHKWVNHKKSVKHHRITKDQDDVDPLSQLNMPSMPQNKITLNLSLKSDPLDLEQADLDDIKKDESLVQDE